MYSDRELSILAAHKLVLRRRIGLRRAECGRLVTRLARPVAWLDRVVAFWRRLSPLVKFAAVPLGFVVTRAITPRFKLLGTLARWGPLAFGALRAVRSLGKARDGSSG